MQAGGIWAEVAKDPDTWEWKEDIWVWAEAEVVPEETTAKAAAGHAAVRQVAVKRRHRQNPLIQKISRIKLGRTFQRH